MSETKTKAEVEAAANATANEGATAAKPTKAEERAARLEPLKAFHEKLVADSQSMNAAVALMGCRMLELCALTGISDQIAEADEADEG